VYGERKESGSRFGLIGHASGDEDDRVPGANDNGAVRLFGHLTRFQGKDPAAQINFNCMNHCVFKSSKPRPETSPGPSKSVSLKGAPLRLELTGWIALRGSGTRPGPPDQFGMLRKRARHTSGIGRLSNEWTSAGCLAVAEPPCSALDPYCVGTSQAGAAWLPRSTALCGNHCPFCAP